MKAIIEILKEKAIEKFGKIEPCQRRLSWKDSVNVHPNGKYLMFWFNDKIGSTHIIRMSFDDILMEIYENEFKGFN